MTAANSLNKIIYADHAATTPIDEDALNLMIELQRKFFANPSSAYKLSRSLKKILLESREKIAACINAEPNEIIFTSGGTESNNWAIKSSVLEILSEHPNIITSAIEHKAILNSCAAMKNLGCTVTKLSVDKFGNVNPDDLRKKILPKTKIISVMFANNEVGTIQPIKSLAEISHAAGKIFHTDAVQAVGHIPIDVKILVVDMLSASAHKFNGPKGIGFLYIRDGLKILPYIDGGGQEFKIALCSMAEVIMLGRSLKISSTEDFIAQLLLSVPPDVKIISLGLALIQAAIFSRDSSKIFFKGRESL